MQVEMESGQARGNMRKARGSASADVIAHFDRIADRYRAEYEAETPPGLAFRIRRDLVLDLLGKGPGRVLDVGCGPGVMSGALRARGWKFWGIDPAPAMIASCVTGSDIHLAVGAVESLPLSAEQFDAVICMGVIERIDDDGQALREMVRVLRPGGSLIVSAPHRLSPSLVWRDMVVYPLLAVLRPIHHRLVGASRETVIRSHRSYTARSLRRLMTATGAVVTDTRYCVVTLPAPLPALMPRWAMAVMRRMEAVKGNPARGLGTVVVVKARKGGLGRD